MHDLTAQDALDRLDSRPEGLDEGEAARRHERFGPNRLEAAGRTPAWKLLAGQFASLLILILVAAALISLMIGDVTEAVAILAIVVLAGLLGFLQEHRAERALEALRALAAPGARVRRDGEECCVPAESLVPGDVVLLRLGDVVPADGRLLQAHGLEAAEALLTGESTPVRKALPALPASTPLAERACLAHAGTAVVGGRGEMVVTTTGMQTELGRIAALVAEQDAPRTPLQLELDRLGRTLGAGALLLAAGMALLGIAQGHGVLAMAIWGVALAVAVIPEALPAVVTISLALGVRRMAARDVLVRRLPAVEALGQVDVICSDKTGTLTTGRMALHEVLLPDGRSVPLHEAHDVLETGVLCNDAAAGDGAGNPTDRALLDAARSAGLDPRRLREASPRVAERAFDSSRRRMTTIHRTPQGLVAWSKGAPEVILADCRTPDEPARRRLLERIDELGRQGMRAIAIAVRPVEQEEDLDRAEQELTCLGAFLLRDPPRPHAREAVARCHAAGIHTMMVTGDHPGTARAVAAELGILREGLVLDGRELDALDDAELARRIGKVEVCARVEPAHKLRIVRALQARGEVVAMTGDGVNDAPALRRAEVGVAMGRSGTQVSREAAELILTDDDFSSIVTAVEEGRRIFVNIRKYLVFLLAGNMGAIFGLVGALLLGWPLPLVAVQILLINMLLDGLPAIALGVEPAEEGLMDQPPRDPGHPMLDGRAIAGILGVGLLIGALALTVFAVTLSRTGNAPRAMTMFFATLVCCRLFNAYNCRTLEGSALRMNLMSNAWLLWGVASALLVSVLAIELRPLSRVFHLRPLGLGEWLVVGAVGSLTLWVVEGAKLLRRRCFPARLDKH